MDSYLELSPQIKELGLLKRSLCETVSVVIPALNEVGTIRGVLEKVLLLIADAQIVDELLVMDGGSEDGTLDVCRDLSVRVVDTRFGIGGESWPNGKGLALWRSQFYTRGSIIIYVDADIENFDTHFIINLLEALLRSPGSGFVKGFYRRPLKTPSGELLPEEGGRVTELLVRPLLRVFYPDLSDIKQPLAGEYGFRRGFLRKLKFSTGYGVEISLLLDFHRKFGREAIAQADLIERVHRNRSISDLSHMSDSILATFLKYASTSSFLVSTPSGAGRPEAEEVELPSAEEVESGF